MAKRIITISREFGSGGRFIGEEVAKKLGIAYYDKNIINQIAQKSDAKASPPGPAIIRWLLEICRACYVDMRPFCFFNKIRKKK